MKTWTLRFRVVDKKNFDALRSGIKSVETRAATEKYRQILPGDSLVITCDGEEMKKRVNSVAVYPSIEDMFKYIPMSTVMPEARTLEEAKKEYYSYAGYEEKIAEHGLIAFEIADPPRERSGALVLHNGKVLLVYRKNHRGEYYFVPGGGVEEGETPEQAAARELIEEAGIAIKVGLKVFDRFDEGVNQHQYFFLAEPSDVLDVVIEAVKWQEDAKQRSNDEYRFEWISLAEIAKIDLRPSELKPLLGRME